MHVWIVRVAILLGFLTLAPALALAQWHGSDYDSLIDALDDNPVETLAIPVLVGVEVADLKANFGESRGGGTRTHQGLDIVAPKGTPIASPTDAVVIGTGSGGDSGIYIRTANPGGEIFVYMHLSGVAEGIVPGKTVTRGEVLGFVGNTGNASGGGAHLHFEIRKNGSATDPFPRLKQAFNADERVAALTKMGEQYVPKVASATTEAMQATEAVTKVVYTFSRNLEVGMEGEDVKALQKFLNANGYELTSDGLGSPGNETLRFGALTRAAVAKYQKANGITPPAGYFGPITRAHISKVASR